LPIRLEVRRSSMNDCEIAEQANDDIVLADVADR